MYNTNMHERPNAGSVTSASPFEAIKARQQKAWSA